MEGLTQPAFAIPVNILPPIICVILSAEPEITEPTTPSVAPPTRNHFLPRRSESEPWVD
jgi:hypothetical protein